jgi:hypothetical protein
MTEVGLLIFLIWCVSVTFVFFVTRDIASPQMMFMASLGVFFSDIFFSQYNLYIYAIYILLLFIVLLTTVIYFQYTPKNHNFHYDLHKNKQVNAPYFSLSIFWILSLPAIIANIYLINMFGGLEGYMMAAKYGTREFHGLGIIKSIISTYYPVSIFYFAYVIKNINSRKVYFFFALHFSIVVIMAILAVSRGTLLTHILAMILVWHYGKSRVKPFTIVSSLGIMLVSAALLGVVRETYSVSEGEVDFGLKGKEVVLKSTWSILGVYPLETMVEAEHIEKKFGLTYLTAITNFVPRVFWPEKPDPGGVIFTRDYAKGLGYDDYSHFTTGLLPEAMINFGSTFGLLFGVFQLFVLLIFLSNYHIKNFIIKRSAMRTDYEVFMTIIYVYSIWHATMLLTGEFTSITIGWLIKIITLSLVYLILRISFQK